LTASSDPPGCDVIVVAAGSSQRMDGVDKLAWPVAGRPLLAYTLAALAAAPGVERMVVVTSPTRRAELMTQPWVPALVIDAVDGGDQRQDSVRAGFMALERLVPDPVGRRIVLVHDGARPIVPAALVTRVVAAAQTHGAAIPVVPIGETVKRVADGRVVATEDRTALALAQTPQAVRRAVLRAALADPVAVTGQWTDEAALLEACRIPVHVVPGDPTNLKVTVPADLARVADLLQPAAAGIRHGIGHDSHPFGPGAPLRLGGVEFDGVPRLVGHSDGDVALHAVADALLGAASSGDLGRVYPAGAATPAGIDSGVMLATVIERLAAAGWRPATIDLTIVAARPRLGDRLDGIRTAIAGHLGLAVEAVSVKASSGNLDGSEGAGRTISALALAAIEPMA
jgi:2-C-methyl-D-erythritol 4-phosphate cytidylyltransferase/2-C-methyl-D-erythritol 2,4-cyclodiphosphate synthase